MSLDLKWNLVFERSPPSASVAVTDFWAERREQQMDDVRDTLKLQLLKNLPLSAVIEACGGKESARTYTELLEAMGQLGIEDAIRIVQR